MAWLLIKATGNPVETSYDMGDIVEVRPDDCNWGTKECLPRFYRMQITGLPFNERLQELCQRMDLVQDSIGVDGEPRYNLVRIRKHKIDVANIPNSIRNSLVNTGIAIISKSQIRRYFKNNQGNVVDIDG